MDKATKGMIKALIAKLEHISNAQSNDVATDSSRDQNIPPTHPNPPMPPLERHYAITYKAEKEWWDEWKPFVEIAGVVLLFVYTLYTIKMYWANKEAADAATSAASTASETLKSSDLSFKQQERAYLWASSFNMANPSTLVDSRGRRVCVDVHVVNSGRTPATGIRLARYVTYGPDAQRTVRAMKIPDRMGPAGDMLGLVGDKYGTAATDPVDSTTEKSLLNGTEPIYIYGVVQYFDIFEIYHETGFCAQRVYNGTVFIACDGFGNWFDKRP